VNAITFTRWLLDAGFSEQIIQEKFVPFGQGHQGADWLRMRKRFV
jgi:hypothetical protein